jgi:hypothetical protein
VTFNVQRWIVIHLTKKAQDTLLFPPSDILPESLFDHFPFCPFATEGKRVADQLGINFYICGQVRTVAQYIAHEKNLSALAQFTFCRPRDSRRHGVRIVSRTSWSAPVLWRFETARSAAVF